jgi:hypothetical protein
LSDLGHGGELLLAIILFLPKSADRLAERLLKAGRPAISTGAHKPVFAAGNALAGLGNQALSHTVFSFLVASPGANGIVVATAQEDQFLAAVRGDELCSHCDFL